MNFHKAERFEKRINSIPLWVTDLFCFVCIASLLYILVVFWTNGSFSINIQSEFSEKSPKLIFICCSVVAAFFYLLMFADASGNKFTKDKNFWLGLLYVTTIVIAPLYYILNYRKARIIAREQASGDL